MHMTPAQFKELSEFMTENAKQLGKEEVVREAFLKHGIKLEFARFLVGFHKLILPIIWGSPMGREAMARSVGPGVDSEFAADDAYESLDEVTDLLDRIDEESLSQVTKVKERGLYVNYREKTGTLEYPSGNSALLPLLEHLLPLLMQSLRGTLEATFDWSIGHVSGTSP
jgi:hypothetical protein